MRIGDFINCKVQLKNGMVGTVKDTGNDYRTSYGIAKKDEKYDNINYILCNYITAVDIDEVLEIGEYSRGVSVGKVILPDDYIEERKESNWSKDWKEEKKEENRNRIVTYLDSIGVSHTEKDGILTIPFGDQVFFVGLKSGKLRVAGSKTWYRFSKVFFEDKEKARKKVEARKKADAKVKTVVESKAILDPDNFNEDDFFNNY